MTPPSVILNDASNRTDPTFAELSARLLGHEEETRLALSGITARLDELLGRFGPATPSAALTVKRTDAATRHQEYEQSNTRLQEAVRQMIPAGANVLVVSKGDDALLRMEGRLTQHFPQGPDGRYAGYHPADSAAALAELERLAGKGAEFLVIPATSLWWLEHYHEFAERLGDTFIFRDETVGAICALPQGKAASSISAGSPSSAHFYSQLRAVVRHLLPAKSRVLVISKGDPELVDFEGLNAAHFPQMSGGTYAGSHPADSATAIVHLEELRAQGAEYLLIPQSSAWWLEEYLDFRAYLENAARLVTRQRNLGIIYALDHGPA